MSELFEQIASEEQLFSVPLSEAQVWRLAEICHLHAGSRVLDLACGRGALLNLWAREYGIKGVGVDQREDVIKAAQQNADAMQVWQQIQYVESDEAEYLQPFHQYNIVSHLGKQPLAGDTVTALSLMQTGLHDESGGILLLGETFWSQPPTEAACAALGLHPDDLPTPGDLSNAFDAAGVDLLEMLIITPSEWDVYHGERWRSVLRWLQDNPQQEAVRRELRESRRTYLHYERDYLGWGVFALVAGI